MSSTSWRITAVPAKTMDSRLVPVLAARKFFAVDASGSTGSWQILESEAEVVKGLHTNKEDFMVTWGSRCSRPIAVTSVAPVPHKRGTRFDRGIWVASMGGTEPASILEEPSALEHIKKSDVWFLLTDGDIDNLAVQRLASKAEEEILDDIPVIFIIAAPQCSTPARINISVGVTFFAKTTNALVLYKFPALGHLYPMAAKGFFAPLVEGAASLDDWDKLPYYKDEEAFRKACQDHKIEVIPASS